MQIHSTTRRRLTLTRATSPKKESRFRTSNTTLSLPLPYKAKPPNNSTCMT